ncbi:hypothetical protein [Pseudonocardia sp. MH-G8]|uniref:hypothetical protein n=1 Tax=Pseudonocardia sp. MH-G8 TaxID=1854588 RepID=UPI000BA17D92|nr:hypothetical protein [Pseudonocardia sp. MH-G8]OZM83580.1 hypothetical protein CFP66_03495 [Pseudonocardia sp. MH-G8]
MYLSILVGCAILLMGLGMTLYGVVVGGGRERAALAALQSALERWSLSRAFGAPSPLADPTGSVPDDLPHRMDRVLLARSGRWSGGHLTVVAFAENDDGCEQHFLLILLDVPAATAGPPCSSGFRRGRRRWARAVANGLALDEADTDRVEQAAGEVDGSLHRFDGRLAVLHYGLLGSALHHGRPDERRLTALLDSSEHLALELTLHAAR